jgi:hypothetical protein
MGHKGIILNLEFKFIQATMEKSIKESFVEGNYLLVGIFILFIEISKEKQCKK